MVVFQEWEKREKKKKKPGRCCSIYIVTDGKESACNVGDLGSIAGSRSFPREGNGNPLQYFYQENPMDRGAWWAILP